MSEIGLGSRVGSYRILALIGQGGMGTVYRAEHLESGEQVALKLLSEGLADSPDFRRRFVREARYARELDHPNIVPVREVGEDGERMYMVMPEVLGADLKTVLALEGPMQPAALVRVLAEVASALDALHARGILHRDVKPANVIVASGAGPQPAGRAYLTDFGLGKDPSRDSAALTAVGEFVGTFKYVAPEQVLGRELDERVDVYSLGCLLYECLTGLPPFPHEREVEVLDAHLEDPPPKATAARSGIPEEIDAVVARAMAKDPAERYGSATELAEAARAALGVLPAVAKPPARLRLEAIAGPAAGDEIEVVAELVIGRDRAGKGRLAGDRELSRRHARIWRGEASYLIEDLGSTNGTLLNGRRLDGPRELAQGDRIELGGSILLVAELVAGDPDEEWAGTARIALRLAVDFREPAASVLVGDGGAELRLVERDGRWTVEPG